MSFRFFLLASLLTLAALRAPAQAPPPKPSFPEVFQAIWETVNSNFYDPKFAGVDWQAVRERYRPQVEQVKDEREFLALMEKMLKELPVSHLFLRVPGRRDVTGLDVQARLIDGQTVVTALPADLPADTQRLRAGDLILTPLGQLAGEPGSTVNLSVQGCDGRTRAVTVRRGFSSFPSERPLHWGKIEAQSGRQIGYLRIARFEESSATQIDAAMSDLSDTAGLIIDLRGNPGGTNSFVRLISYLVQGQRFVSGLLTRPFLSRLTVPPEQIDLSALHKTVGDYSINSLLLSIGLHGAIALYTEDLGDKLYRGDVILLCDGGTASAAEGLIAYLKQQARAVTVGRTTAGRLLTSNNFRLPNGWQLVVPIAVPISSDKKLFKDTPLPPDFAVRWTRQDVCEGRDPDMAKALEVLAQRPRPGAVTVPLAGRN